MDPGNPLAQYGEAARSPGRKPNRYPLFPFSLADVWALPARPRHPSSSLDRRSRRRPFPPCKSSLFNSRKCPAISISSCAYKSPQMSSLDPLSSSGSRRRRFDGIDRRTPRSLWAFPVEFANDGEPETLPSPLSSSPPTGAPSWPPPWFNPAAIQRGHPRPKITVAPRLSSRLPSPCLEAIEEGDHAPESTAPSCILSWRHRSLGITRTPPAFVSSMPLPDSSTKP
jgi:hypothetical protein